MDLLRIVAPPLVPLALFSLLLHLGALAQLLPRPRPALDTDRTILLHQAAASQSSQNAGVLLIGDSSCLMDVSALDLGSSLPGRPSVLNLGTLSYLDIGSYGRLLREYLAANRPPSVIVLLMHPEALRRLSPAEYDVQTLEHFYAGTDYCTPSFPPVLCALGVEIFRGRLWARAVPQPLPGNFGRVYGFTHDLWKYLSAHGGSALDPGQFDPATAHGNAEYRLARSLETGSKAFRAVVPQETKLLVGITPTPESYVGPGFSGVYSRLLRGWNEWLGAHRALEDLPPTLPDHLFASTTHLNQRGVEVYTRRLAELIAREGQAEIRR